MTDQTNIAERVKRQIADVLGAEEVKDEHSLRDDLGADSLDEVQIVMAMEDEFGIDIPDDEGESALTVADVIKLVEKKVA